MHAYEVEVRNGVCKGRQWENGRDGYWLWVTGLGEDEGWVMNGLAEGFGFSAIGLASGRRKWMPAHSIRDCSREQQ